MKRIGTSELKERELGQQLLRSMCCDVPSASSKAATLRALGLVSGSAIATAKTGVAGAAVSKTGAVIGTSAAVGSSLAKAALTSTMLGFAIGAATIGVGAGLMKAVSPAPMSAPRSPSRANSIESRLDSYRQESVPVRTPEPESSSSESSSSASLEVPVSIGQALTTSPSRATRVARKEPPATASGSGTGDFARSAAQPEPEPNSAPTTQVSTSSLPRETAQLDRVRAALREGDFRRSLLESDRYDRAFDAGVLRQEAAVLRIETTFRTGDVTRARSLFEAFVRAYPTNPHASRLRKLLAQ